MTAAARVQVSVGLNYGYPVIEFTRIKLHILLSG